MSEDLLKIFSNCIGITSDSRKVKAGYIFLAYPGHYQDGRNYIQDALKKGASYIFYEPQNFETDLNQLNFIPITNLKNQVSIIASEFYNYPSKKIEVIGVTGTNGKTTVVGWLQQALTLLNKKSAWIGTLGYGDSKKINNTLNTTPDAIVIQEIINQYVSKKYSFMAMEVSSHAIQQKRIEAVNFGAKILTNVSRDHLDYHSSLQEYQKIKKSFFASNASKFYVINADDEIGKQIIKEKNVKIISYGLRNNADLVARNIVYDKSTTFDLIFRNKKYHVSCNFFGAHNISNLLSVITTLIGYQFNIDEIIHCVGKLKPICGRLERVFLKQAENTNIFLDYAHTPDALEKVLLALKETFAKKIILVFGCGGDRDPGKRKEMGIIASKLADHIIVTSDNPRSENPAQIMLHIVSAITTPYLMIENRSEAIKRAMQLINHDNILLIAGKGHEEYQEIEGKKIPYSDRETVLRVLKKNGTT